MNTIAFLCISNAPAISPSNSLNIPNVKYLSTWGKFSIWGSKKT